MEVTIIVSDCDEAIRELYADLFHDAGYLTKVVEPQATSATSIGAAQVDIALLEVIPEALWDTLSLVEELRACPKTAHLPVVLLSTAPTLLDGLRAPLGRLGCTCVVKPFQVDELLNHVGKVLATRPPMAA